MDIRRFFRKKAPTIKGEAPALIEQPFDCLKDEPTGWQGILEMGTGRVFTLWVDLDADLGKSKCGIEMPWDTLFDLTDEQQAGIREHGNACAMIVGEVITRRLGLVK